MAIGHVWGARVALAIGHVWGALAAMAIGHVYGALQLEADPTSPWLQIMSFVRRAIGPDAGNSYRVRNKIRRFERGCGTEIGQ